MPRRRIFPAALAAAAVVAVVLACTQTATPQAGGVSGTYDLARVGNLVFVTSADRSELRVLDARGDGGVNDAPPHDWVRAPNPLEVLEIPVFDGRDRPVGLSRDLDYSVVELDALTPPGGEVTGPYVYAIAAARPEISVVGADPSQLKQLKLVGTDGPVTAISAMGPSATASAASTLFYATLVGGRGNLYRARLMPPDQIGDQSVAPELLAQVNPNETITALQALPLHRLVAVAVRSSQPSRDGGAAAVTGRAFAFDPETRAPVRELKFGAPIRALTTHPGTADNAVLPEVNVFGLVDEESCGGSGTPGCARLLAVDVATGERANDFTGTPAPPITFPRGLPQTMTFTANARVRSRVSPEDAGGLIDVPVMGMATSTSGEVYFFEAVGRPGSVGDPARLDSPPQWTLRHVNQSLIPPVATGFFYENAAGAALTYPDQLAPDAGPDTPYYGLVQATVAPGLGTAVAQPLSVTYEGQIPGLASLPIISGELRIPPAGNPAAGPAQPGDLIVVFEADGTACAELHVASISATAFTPDAPPSGCASPTTFTLRAARPNPPYVVVGLASGYMGRVADGTQAPGQPVAPATFTFAGGTPYYRPDPSDSRPDVTQFPPALAFQMGLPAPDLARDFRYVLSTSTGFEPLFFALSTDISGWPGYHLPYGLVHLPTQPRLYITYPSVARSTLLGAGAVIELNPTLMAPNQPNAQITSAYR
ncbi:MAG TPA: hypothetical protein VND93_30960 [Myxococcales bacterium]|nr:hypothetical protein [Myxococcales bacterium]